MSDDNEKRYTLFEAQLELDRRRCLNEGHQIDFIVTRASNDPVKAYCTRCATTWKMERIWPRNEC